MTECEQAIQAFEDRVDEALGHVEMVVEPYVSLSLAARLYLQSRKDAVRQAALDFETAIVAVMIVEAAG